MTVEVSELTFRSPVLVLLGSYSREEGAIAAANEVSKQVSQCPELQESHPRPVTTLTY